MLHFLPNYFFFAAERQHKKRLRNQTPRAFTRTRKKHAMLHGCNIFRHPHQQNASRQTIAKKTRNNVTFPRHTWILHVTCDVYNVTQRRSSHNSESASTAVCWVWKPHHRCQFRLGPPDPVDAVWNRIGYSAKTFNSDVC